MPPKADWEKYEKRVDEKDEKIVALDDSDIQILKTYGQGPYAGQLKKIEQDIKDIQKRVNEKLGVKESDTGLAPPNLWDVAADRQRIGEEGPLQVARCTKIIPVDPEKKAAAEAVNPLVATKARKALMSKTNMSSISNRLPNLSSDSPTECLRPILRRACELVSTGQSTRS